MMSAACSVKLCCLADMPVWITLQLLLIRLQFQHPIGCWLSCAGSKSHDAGSAAPAADDSSMPERPGQPDDAAASISQQQTEDNESMLESNRQTEGDESAPLMTPGQRSHQGQEPAEPSSTAQPRPGVQALSCVCLHGSQEQQCACICNLHIVRIASIAPVSDVAACAWSSCLLSAWQRVQALKPKARPWHSRFLDAA